jgi:PAS domain S-box-containing protein
MPPDAINGDSVYRALFTAYADALLVTNARGRVLLANPSACALLGYDEAELVGLNVDALVPDTIRPRHAAYREAYAVDPRPRPMGKHMELVARRKDGSQVTVEIALSPLQVQGAPIVVAAIRDIGSYPRVKRALQRARYSDHLAQLGRLAVDARDPHEVLARVPRIASVALEVESATIYLLEKDGTALRVVAGHDLPACEQVGALLANRPEEPAGWVMAGRCPLVVEDLTDEPGFTIAVARWETGIRSLLAVPLLDRGQVIGVVSVGSRQAARFDDDELDFLESLASLLANSLQRAQSEEGLRHAQRLESVGQLTGGIAHDFNNLLTVIQGNLQVLEELPVMAEQAEAQQLVAAAARASQRGAELTGKLLAFARRQVLSPSAVDASGLLHALADMLRRTLDPRILIELDAPPCPACLADAGQLETALLNIAINARDAMPGGGTLRFRCEARATLPADVQGGNRGDPEVDLACIAISVSDTGQGMSDEVRAHAFEPFFTTKEAGRGTGLGLSTVYGFVKQSRGAATLASTPGQGTTVTLFIPQVTEAGAATAAQAAQATGETLAAGVRVLLVEDDADVRAVMEAFLLALGCAVTGCASGEQAQWALDNEGVFDLLLTDIALGAGIRGTELAALAQAGRPGIAVLLMSGYSEELIDADRDSPSGWGLLRKPCSRGELARALALALEARD